MFWSYEGRKVGHLALAKLPSYQEYTHGQAVFPMQNLERGYYFDIESNTVLRMLEVLGLCLAYYH